MANHNSVVGPDDLVIFLGDVCYQKTPERLRDVQYFNGRKILFRGNHDRVFTDAQLSPHFEQIIPEGEGRYYTFGDIKCYATHYPTLGVGDAFNLVGHIHSAWKYQLNMLNVGVDVHHFRPVDGERIPFHFAAVSTYYDNDVWAAYLPINADLFGVRGAKGSYFPLKTP